MRDKLWFKWILYVILTIACAFSGFLVYYGTRTGILQTSLFEHLVLKILILGIPVFLCLVIDFMYQPFEMLDAIAWKTSIGTAFICLLVGYIVIRDKQVIQVFGISISATLIYILMYAIPVVVSYLLGLLDVYIGEDPTPKHAPAPPRTDTQPPAQTPGCGAGGFPEEMGPNHIPNSLKGPF